MENLTTLENQVAIVTGANRGLGLEVCRQLGGLGARVVLTSRVVLQGRMKMEDLRRDGHDMDYHQLDVTALDSVKRLARYLESTYGRVDILVNNAGVLLDRTDAHDPRAGSVLTASGELFDDTFAVNVFGALRVAQNIAPLMTAGGRMINVSSGMGQLHDMGGYWPAYRVSKAALNALTRMAADELRSAGVLVNAVCPGWVRTDLGGPDAPVTVADGAAGIVWAATLPPDGPSGGFFRNGDPLPW